MTTKENTVLPGMKFGRWTVLDAVQPVVRSNGKTEYKRLCRCDCGTERFVLERALRYGGSTSCGCLREEETKKARGHQLARQTFGELMVLHKAENQRTYGGIWWTCRCSCGNLCDVSGSMLTTGRKNHCGGQAHPKNYATADVKGQRFHNLTALYPLQTRDAKGSVMWHCRCDCGNEVDISYNNLVFSNQKSCGCQKKEHEQKLHAFLTHVAGTSVDMLKSKKLPSDNTSGYKGVYRIKGKFVAKIVFQKKAYYLGAYETIEEAAKARREAEEMLFDGVTEHYEKWKQKAANDPTWASENPIRIQVTQNENRQLSFSLFPVL